jgi:Uma2 family endonuclease
VISGPARRIHRYTYEAYLDYEADSNRKHEFFDGEIYAMAGGSPEHAALAMAVGAALVRGLEGKPCVVYSSDLKVRVEAANLTTYPDVTVICGAAEQDARSRHVVLNPTVLVEVTSPGTEDWDRGEKLEHYKTIPSLREVVVVSHRSRRLELVRREADGSWSRHAAGPGEALTLASVGCALETDRVYRNVDVSG